MGIDDVGIETLRQRCGKKWSTFGGDVIPAWGADMDLAPPEPVRLALAARAQAGDLGYGESPDRHPLKRVFCAHALRHYGWQVEPTSVQLLSDVIQGLYLGLQTFCEPGDGVVVFTPVYPPFPDVCPGYRSTRH